MRNLRFVFFFQHFQGPAIGILWLGDQPGYGNLDATTLRDDYKTDYVLMVAEVYRRTATCRWRCAALRLSVLTARRR